MKTTAARRLALEGLGIAAVIGGAALALYLLTVHPARNSRPLGGVNVDVSQVRSPQTEVSIAADPRDPRVLLAGVNDDTEQRFRAYTTTDGGSTWHGSLGPSMADILCSRGDPAVGIDARGREYYAWIRAQFNPSAIPGVLCPGDLTTELEVAVRDGTTGAWRTQIVAHRTYEFGFDDKPALAVTPAGRVYVVWSRLFSNFYETTVVSYSDDGGTTWSRPTIVSKSLVMPQLVSVVADGRGVLYVTGVDARHGVWITRSRDGKRFEPMRAVAPVPAANAANCSAVAHRPLPQQAQRCTGPNPSIALLRNRVVVVFGTYTAKGVPSVSAVALNENLRPVQRTPRVGLAVRDGAQQFWPVAAADTRGRRMWACYYDTTGSSNKARAWFTCTTSRDGMSWTAPIRAASVPSVLEAVLGDGAQFGGYPSLVVAGTTAHPAWIDTRKLNTDEEIFTAAISPQRAIDAGPAPQK